MKRGAIAMRLNALNFECPRCRAALSLHRT